MTPRAGPEPDPAARPATDAPRPHELLRAGTAAGLVAGAAMLAWMVAASALADLSPARPLALAAATFSRDAVEGGPVAVLVGALLWVAVSVALALLYGTFIPRDFPFVSAAIIGVGYAFVVLGVAASAVLPRVNPAMREGMPETGGAWVIAYAAFGAALGLVPVLRRRWSGRLVDVARLGTRTPAHAR